MPAVPPYLDAESYAVVEAACERLIPAVHDHPGATVLGVADYVDGLLGAFLVDPPRIFAGGPFSGRAGGEARFDAWLPLGRLEERAWRARIAAWQEQYRTGVAALGADFATVDGEDQDRRLAALPEFATLLHEHACEGAYGAPEYGGNRDMLGWRAIQFPGDVQPRGYTDEQVSGRE